MGRSLVRTSSMVYAGCTCDFNSISTWSTYLQLFASSIPSASTPGSNDPTQVCSYYFSIYFIDYFFIQVLCMHTLHLAHINHLQVSFLSFLSFCLWWPTSTIDYMTTTTTACHLDKPLSMPAWQQHHNHDKDDGGQEWQQWWCDAVPRIMMTMMMVTMYNMMRCGWPMPQQQHVHTSAKQPFSATDTTVSMLVYKSVQSGQTCTHCTTIHTFSMQSVQPGQYSIVYPSLPKKKNNF